MDKIKKLLGRVPPTIGLTVDVLLIIGLVIDLYKYFKKPKKEQETVIEGNKDEL